MDEKYIYICSSAVPIHLRHAAKSLRMNQDIVILKADKIQNYVILDYSEYLKKLDELVVDTNKFKRITKDPTNGIKQKVNALILKINNCFEEDKLSKLIGEYAPGYLYGVVKTHKVGNPLRPIILQCPTPTYLLAKYINSVISPYCPSSYSLKSSLDFVDLMHSCRNDGICAALDVESLFTNVPVQETIAVICGCVYNHETLPPPVIPEELLIEVLQICTTESPFRQPN